MSKPKAQAMPHSWPVSAWDEQAPGVHPNTTSAAKTLVRQYRDELIAHGALCRVGRNLTVIGEGYARFLASKMQRAAGSAYPLDAANRARKNLTHTSAPSSSSESGATP